MDVEEGTAYQEELKLCQLKIADAFFTLWGNKSILFNKFRTRACFMNIERVVILSTLKNSFVGFVEAVLFFRIISRAILIFLGIPHLLMLHFILLHRYCFFCCCFFFFFLQIEGLWYCKSLWVIFQASLSYIVSLCNILVILSIFQTFLLFLHLLWLAVTSDIWCSVQWLSHVQFFATLWITGRQACPSLTSGVHPNSCPLSQWCDPTILNHHPLLSPFLLTFNLSQHQDLFQWVNSSHQVAKVLEFQL